MNFMHIGKPIVISGAVGRVAGETPGGTDKLAAIGGRFGCERCSAFWAPAWPLAWPGPQDGLGQGGTKAEVGQGSIWVQKLRKSERSQNRILYSGKS